MSTHTRPITYGIPSDEIQGVFNVDKYVALAYQQPKGVLLQEQVETRWEEWCRKVAEASWLRNWRRSKHYRAQCVTPADMCCLVYGCGNVPLAIYGSAVWGFGIDGWLKVPDVTFQPLGNASNRELNLASSEILRLQGHSRTQVTRAYGWDDPILRSCGMCMPPEYGDLDRWLQPMWDRVCNSSK